MKHMAFAAVALALCAAPATGQLNKCIGQDGKTVYTDKPCASGSKSAEVRGRQPQAATSPQSRAATAPPRSLALDGELMAQRGGVFGHWCVERWNSETSPAARESLAAELRRQAHAGGEEVRERLRKAGLTLEQAVQQQVQAAAVNPFNADCSGFGFRPVGPSTDAQNEQASRALQQQLEKQPGSREAYERARR